MLVYRSTVAAAAFAGALLVGCSEPDLPTDLRKDGPPDITTVTVMSDLRTGIDSDFPMGPFDLSRLIESATHCRLNDDKRPGLVGLPTLKTTQVCPDDLSQMSDVEGVAEGAPPNWFVRVVFDELLDPNVEDLVPQSNGVVQGTIANTQPVTLKCDGVDVPYGGYYVPNGNRVSWPLGPALFIQPTDATSVKTGATCEVGIKDMVHNKKGQQVPSDQRSFPFKIAPMKLRFVAHGKVDPSPANSTLIDFATAADGSLELDPTEQILFYWTAAFVDQPAPVDPNLIHIFEGTDPSVCGSGGTPVATTDIETATGSGAAMIVATTTALVMNLDLKSQSHGWKENTTYRIEFDPSAKVTPKQGGADGTFPASFKLCFHTTAAM